MTNATTTTPATITFGFIDLCFLLQQFSLFLQLLQFLLDAEQVEINAKPHNKCDGQNNKERVLIQEFKQCPAPIAMVDEFQCW
jgi:hypothetical protein